MSGREVAIAGWNVGGGFLGRSHQQGRRPNLEYHAAAIRDLDASLVLLQECQAWGEGDNQVQELASRLGFRHWDYIPLSSSHFDDSASLGLGLMSSWPATRLEVRLFDNPGLTAIGPTGDTWRIADKGFATWRVQASSFDVTALNAHCFPLHYFGADVREARFRNVWGSLGTGLCEAAAGPLVAVVDLNTEMIDELLGETLTACGVQEVLPRVATTPKGVQQDYLLASHHWRVVSQSVSPTQSDHHLLRGVLNLAGEGTK